MLNLRREAIEDLRYLLSRGYQRSSAVKFVGDRYVLERSQRLLLYRAVFPEEVALRRRNKIVPPDRLQSHTLAIDGFNVLWTVASAMEGMPVYLCDDGFIRDTSAIHGSVSKKKVSKPLKFIVSALVELQPKESLFFFDKSISRSGEIAGKVRTLLSENGLKGDARTVASPDFEVLASGGVVATSDSVIVEKASLVFDLAGHIIKEHLRIKPMTLI
ncbi:MAG: DUF434 domain-containing protein [Candidatus Methanomethylicaceae archaeon]